MTPSLEIAYAGMKASLDQLQCIGEQMAHLVSGNDPTSDVVELITGQHTFDANAAVARSSDEVVGSIIDLTV
ncbi:MAG: hypothetical protein JSU77_08200 [Fidelibacterota bacterium]|nr:MAG: hypothetical protein JSU77_08200 [Candidatus Neomarinimicrobiota bacterium]